MSNVSYHITEKAEVLFMAVTRPIPNKYKHRNEFVIKLKVPENSETIKHLLEISPKKINTDLNNKLAINKEPYRVISFDSIYHPIVLDDKGNRVYIPAPDDKPEILLPDLYSKLSWFNGETDKATAQVVYKRLAHFNDSIKLQGIKILSIDVVPKEENKPVNDIIEEIRQFLN